MGKTLPRAELANWDYRLIVGAVIHRHKSQPGAIHKQYQAFYVAYVSLSWSLR
jgi:hypothetical protein